MGITAGRKLYKQLETDEESGFRLARTDGSVTEYTTQCQRLVQEALAGIRGRVGEAEQLYAELQCGIQHAREIRRLEAGVEAVTGWVLGPGADLLRQLILRGIGQDPDSVLVLQQELEHLELKCRVSFIHPQPSPGREIISSPEVVNQKINNAHLDLMMMISRPIKNNPAGPALLMMNLRCAVLVLDMI